MGLVGKSAEGGGAGDGRLGNFVRTGGFGKGRGSSAEEIWSAEFSERISLFSRNFCGFVDSVRVCLGLCGAFAGLWQEGEKPYANCDFQRSDVSSLSPVTVDILSGFFF